MNVPPTIPEPRFDIAAQFRAMLDPASPKDAVFIAAGTEATAPGLPPGVIDARRAEGALYTTSRRKADAFLAPVLDDAVLALILGYPETKADVAASGEATLFQVLDPDGAVIIEAVASRKRAYETLMAFGPYVPDGGSLIETTPLSAIGRRTLICAREKALVGHPEKTLPLEIVEAARLARRDGAGLA